MTSSGRQSNPVSHADPLHDRISPLHNKPDRRAILSGAAAVPLASTIAPWPDTARADTLAGNRLAALEQTTGGRLGVAALNTDNSLSITQRHDERFAFCSTFKVLLASAILQRSAAEPRLLERRVGYTRADLVTYSPITQKHVGEGLAVSELCAAALQYSDNTAANLLLQLIGGPAAVTAFAQSIGDDQFKLSRWETALNDAMPGDPRDTTTPAAMMRSLHRLALGDVLSAVARKTLITWMLGSTTGGLRLRAAVPPDWTVADKTGTGDYGTTNVIGLMWPKDKPPIMIAVYFTQSEKTARPRDDVVAMAARIAVEALAP